MKTQKPVKIGGVQIGGGAPVAIQSMTNTPTADAAATVRQIHALEDAGCEIVRVAVPDMESARAISEIKKQIHIPLVADIHFDYRLALEAIARGVDKVRLNPGNIGDEARVKSVADAARAHGVPIRIGVNAGSLEKGLLQQCGSYPAAMAESARRHVALLNRWGFDDIVLSMKASSVQTTIAAYRLAKEAFPYPLHLGVTEAGTAQQGLVKSAIGIGALLADGIGDTIRVSLTDDPVCEVRAAQQILRALGLGKPGVEVISCPTCARTKIDLIPIAKAVSEAVADIPIRLKVAVMGCVVNGPGEARDADIGIAGGDGCAVLFRHGEIVRKIPEDEIIATLIDEIRKMAEV